MIEFNESTELGLDFSFCFVLQSIDAINTITLVDNDN
ncbi:hypothetical protein CLV42_111170 [Chitinophaga ginsengisoli]|uniref:Uncharacterized protein n=1 Tax=Chitinophaga ginsengisoli TaxID=363837 RepID=A0A2P8FXL1_9BACT|nr:hypothetical protein CLV42_111170 [Chitinophaga ginsengisoli]